MPQFVTTDLWLWILDAGQDFVPAYCAGATCAERLFDTRPARLPGYI